MSNSTVLGVLVLGLIGGGLLGYLIGGLRRELFDRNLRHANTRLRSLELDRQLLGETLDITRRELDDLRLRNGDRELVLVVDPSTAPHVESLLEPELPLKPELPLERIEPDELSEDAGGRSPERVAVEVEEPDPVTLPELEYPKVRFG